jgi:hypothetical protein
MALYVDEVAVEYTFSAPPAFEMMLRYLFLMKPLAENGIIRFFRPNLHMHTSGGAHDAWAQFRDVLKLDESEESRLFGALGKFESRGSRRISAQTAHYLVASQLMTKAVMPNKINVLGRNEAELVLFDTFARLSKMHSTDRHGYDIAKLVGLRVPLYSLNISELASVRRSESAFAEWRDAMSKALGNIETLPDGTQGWQEQARETTTGELIPLQRRIEQATRASPFLSKARAGINVISFSAIGAAAGMLVGGNFKSDFAGGAVAAAAQIASEYWRSVDERKRLMAVKDLIIAFTRADF